MERATYGKASEYYDDCGAWDRNGKAIPTSYYPVKGEYVSLILRLKYYSILIKVNNWILNLIQTKYW